MVGAPITVMMGGVPISVFRLCGFAGLVLGAGLALTFATIHGLSVWVQIAIGVAGGLAFVAVAAVTAAITRRDSLTFYHHAPVVLAAGALVAVALGAPVLPHLDASAIGLFAFLVCGRVGCALVGCCHGRPSPWGVRYGARHVAAGFPDYLGGVRLVPTQPLEAALAALLVIAALLVPGPPGTSIGLLLCGYAVGRFLLETVRGDPVRPVWRGTSEAQWSSLAIVFACIAAPLPGQEVFIVAVTLLAVAVATQMVRAERLNDACHVRELARLLPEARTCVAETSRGLRLSIGLTEHGRCYTLSRSAPALSRGDARRLGEVILALRHETGGELIQGVGGTWHFMLGSSRENPHA